MVMFVSADKLKMYREAQPVYGSYPDVTQTFCSVSCRDI